MRFATCFAIIVALPFSHLLFGQHHVLNFEQYEPGTVLSNLTSDLGYTGIEVFGEHPSCPTLNAAVIFDSACPGGCTGFDDDLGTPNQSFGGPGVGDGGKAGSPFSNDTSLGNLLVLHQYCQDLGEDISQVEQPQDFYGNSRLHLTFPDDVIIYSLTGIDIETDEEMIIHFYDKSDELIHSVHAPQTGDNGVVTFSPDEQEVQGVRKLIVEREGSGALDQIVFDGDRADLRLSKYVDNAAPDSSDLIVFLVTVVNDGPNDATNVEVTDYLPDELEYIFAEATGGLTSHEGGQVKWSITEFVVGDSFAVEIGAKVNTGAPFENTAEVTASDQPDPDSTPGNGEPSEDDQDRVIVTPRSITHNIFTSNEKDAATNLTGFSLGQNYPNPFNPTTEITYELTEAMPARLVVYNTLGQELTVLADGFHSAGQYTVRFDADLLPSGLFLYRLETPDGISSRTMSLLK